MRYPCTDTSAVTMAKVDGSVNFQVDGNAMQRATAAQLARAVPIPTPPPYKRPIRVSPIPH